MTEVTEAQAKAVFDAMVWAVEQPLAGKPPTWFPGGNSFAQDRARQAAREVEAARIPAPAPDVERVARAMARVELVMGDPEHEVQQRVDDQWSLYAPLAEAALSALPIPATGEVERAFFEGFYAAEGSGSPGYAWLASEARAALTDHTTNGAE